jgi:hypothetical protein
MIWDTRSQMGDSNFSLPNIDQKVKKTNETKGDYDYVNFLFIS